MAKNSSAWSASVSSSSMSCAGQQQGMSNKLVRKQIFGICAAKTIRPPIALFRGLTKGHAGESRRDDTVRIVLPLRVLHPDPFFRNFKGLRLRLREERRRKKKSSISSPPGTKGMERALAFKAGLSSSASTSAAVVWLLLPRRNDTQPNEVRGAGMTKSLVAAVLLWQRKWCRG